MSKLSHPYRSVLYMPGSNARALEKAKTLAVDALIFDLEDSVAPDQKALAREQVCAAANAATEGAYGKRQIIVRSNALDTDWGEDDLKAIASCGANAVLLPKVDRASDIHTAQSLLESAGLHTDATIWAMMET
ncbi:MAG: CoA ester lyase, partial [Pseudomonadales bacterium]|nr:CoA ester lyase [Pseudomonadales bacterium]